MDKRMERKFGLYIFTGLLMGVFFGTFMGAGSANPMLGVGGGALAGAFIGWFIATALLEKEKGKKDDEERKEQDEH